SFFQFNMAETPFAPLPPNSIYTHYNAIVQDFSFPKEKSSYQRFNEVISSPHYIQLFIFPQ
ncbi:hypothetical protein, partial [Anaerovibrio lipolyticus]|uniref:hypothetical protein n=1 Tax=Anaerovibrio lipolyticus TaxID=82374 RepID=UPI0019553DCA